MKKLSHLLSSIFIIVVFLFLQGCADPTTSNPSSIPSSDGHDPLIFNCLLTNASCTMERLPLIGLTLNEGEYIPTVDTIMSRVSTSRPWMKENFRAILESHIDSQTEELPEIFMLFNAVTGIIIDEDIRPSYYSAAKAGIYLDAANVWLSVAQRLEIPTDPDFRSAFADQFNFVITSRYTVPCNSAICPSDNIRLYSNSNFAITSRNIEEVSIITWRLLFHELAHANDYIPPSELALKSESDRNINLTDTPLDIALRFSPQRISNVLYSRSVIQGDIPYNGVAHGPLQSVELRDLSRTLYGGAISTTAMRAYDGTETGAWFEDDGATNQYNYYTRREDVAMLFQDVMMYYIYGATKDYAYLYRPSSTTPTDLTCDDYTIQWGDRARIGHPNVQPRAQFVLEQILPLHKINRTLDLIRWSHILFEHSALNPPLRKQLEHTTGWCQSLGVRPPDRDNLPYSFTIPKPPPQPFPWGDVEAWDPRHLARHEH